MVPQYEYDMTANGNPDHRPVMFFAVSLGNMVTVKQIHHKIRGLIYKGLGM